MTTIELEQETALLRGGATVREILRTARVRLLGRLRTRMDPIEAPRLELERKHIDTLERLLPRSPGGAGTTLIAGLAALFLLAWASSAAAQDSVELRSPDGGGAQQTRLSLTSGASAEVKLFTTFDAQTNVVTGLPLIPTADSDAASKAYVDSVAGGASRWVSIADSAGAAQFTASGADTLRVAADTGGGLSVTFNAATKSLSYSIMAGGVTNGMLVNSSLTVTAGPGLTGGGPVSLGGTTTLGLDYSATPSANPSLSASRTVFGSAGLVFEGSTADTFEGLLTVANPTADQTWTLPNASGTLALTSQLTSGTVTSVGSGSGLTGGPITAAGTLSIAAGGVASGHIADGTIGFGDIGQNGAASGQVPMWNGIAWAPATIGGMEGSGNVPVGGVIFGTTSGDVNLVASGYSPLPGSVTTVTEGWSSTTTTGAPTGRTQHTAVWTGAVMIVWGGENGASSYLNSGGRYDPATNTWTATNLTGAPTARAYQTAVWTGSRMVIWGGLGTSLWNTGGQYDPATDSWTATSTTGAPLQRYRHTAVWTGTLMLVWGGSGNPGGRYDPSTDTWTPLTTAGQPTWRYLHTAVWTGSRMIVWGGYDGTTFYDTGGQYDPVADAWTSTSTVGAPQARFWHRAVWTGTQMIVWGGSAATGFNSGGRYDPPTDTWAATTTVGAPTARDAHAMVWTGSVMVVWSGWPVTNTGGRYDPVTDSWSATSTTGAPGGRAYSAFVWTGSQMVVWGGYDGGYIATGGRYTPPFLLYPYRKT